MPACVIDVARRARTRACALAALSHQKKLEDFLKNPTVRPGMENLTKEQIAKQHGKRADHLRKEIDTFKENIEKLKSGKKP